jgi:hypothetical protein
MMRRRKAKSKLRRLSRCEEHVIIVINTKTCQEADDPSLDLMAKAPPLNLV